MYIYIYTDIHCLFTSHTPVYTACRGPKAEGQGPGQNISSERRRVSTPLALSGRAKPAEATNTTQRSLAEEKYGALGTGAGGAAAAEGLRRVGRSAYKKRCRTSRNRMVGKKRTRNHQR